MAKTKFDNWSDVKDCNDCEHYWNKLCDGTKVGTEKRCTAFSATRRVDIPGQINDLRKSVKQLCVALIFSDIAIILQALDLIFGG